MVHSHMENAAAGLRQHAPHHLARPAGEGAALRSSRSARSRRPGSSSTPCRARTCSPTPTPSTATSARSTPSGSRSSRRTTSSSPSSAAAASSARACRRRRTAYMAPADSRTTDLVTKLAERPPRPLARLGRRGRAGPGRGAGRAGRRRPELTRRNIAERDPANEMGDRFFGQEMTSTLVRALWGGDRQLPRAPAAGLIRMTRARRPCVPRPGCPGAERRTTRCTSPCATRRCRRATTSSG